MISSSVAGLTISPSKPASLNCSRVTSLRAVYADQANGAAEKIAQSARHDEAVERRQAEVEQHRIGQEAGRVGERRFAIVRDAHAMLGRQQRCDRIRERAIVFDEKNAGHASQAIRACSRRQSASRAPRGRKRRTADVKVSTPADCCECGASSGDDSGRRYVQPGAPGMIAVAPRQGPNS